MLQKIINFDDVTKKIIEDHNPNWPQIDHPDHPCRISTIGGSGFGKTNLLFNVISHQPDIDKIYLHVEDPYKAKSQCSINKRESTG